MADNHGITGWLSRLISLNTRMYIIIEMPLHLVFGKIHLKSQNAPTCTLVVGNELEKKCSFLKGYPWTKNVESGFFEICVHKLLPVLSYILHGRIMKPRFFTIMWHVCHPLILEMPIYQQVSSIKIYSWLYCSIIQHII